MTSLERTGRVAGLQNYAVPHSPGFNALLLYPSTAAARPTPFGPYEMTVSVDAPPVPGRFSLVMISHGGGGSPLLYRSIGLLLARQGFMVALPKHPGNSLGDDALAESEEKFRTRPRQLVTLLDALYADPLWSERIAPGSVTAIGHSMGGYTVLSCAGGQPWTRSGERIEVPHDTRIGELVLLAPACGPYLAPAALRHVTAPILALTAEHDPLTPDAQVRRALASVADPSRVSIETVPNAGHFSFLSPFPRSMRSPEFAPSQDPSGFDRDRFHRWLPDRILRWIHGHRATPGAPRG